MDKAKKNSGGRPKVGAGIKKTEKIYVNLNINEKKKLSTLIAKSGESYSGFVRRVLKENRYI